MDRADAIRTLQAHASSLRRHGVEALYLFGSTARGEARADSDVDVLVDYVADTPVTLVEFIRLQEELSRVLGHSADLTTRAGLHPLVRADVEGDLLRVI